MSNRGKVLTAVLFSMGVTCVAYKCLADPFEDMMKSTLKGISGVRVLVENMSPEAERDGLTKAQIKTDAELRLRKAGIRVLNEADRDRANGDPCLYICVNAQKRTDANVYAVSYSVQLIQGVILERNHEIRTVATTWESNGLGSVGAKSLRSVRDSLNDYVDQFINAYLAENPPVPASQPGRR